MKLFTKMKKRESSSWSNAIRSFFDTVKCGVCDFLNSRAGHWSVKQLKIYWFFFVLVGIAISMEIVIHALVNQKSPAFNLKPAAFYSPVIIPAKRSKQSFEIILGKINAYKKAIDSLAFYDSSKYKLLILDHPYLLDSMESFKKLLYQELK
jgi:hypothetical protein